MSVSTKHVSILGFGGIGRILAFHLLSSSDDCELNIIDNNPNVKGAFQDLEHAQTVYGKRKIHLNNFDLLEEADFIFHSAGLGVPHGEDRAIVVAENSQITKSLFESRNFKETCKVIVIANPVDAITYFTWKYSGLNRSNVVGVGTYLDSKRMSYFMANQSINKDCILLGEHGKNIVFCEQLTFNNQAPNDDEKEIINKCIQQTIYAAHSIKAYGDASIYGVSGCAIELYHRLQSNTVSELPLTTALNPDLSQRLDCERTAISLIVEINKTGAYPKLPKKLLPDELEKMKASAQWVEASILTSEELS